MILVNILGQSGCLGKTAELAQKYLTKGSEVAIEGKLTSRNYTSKEGEKKYITEIVVNELLKQWVNSNLF